MQGDFPVFFHVDLDAFFASVEQREHPEYKGKPVIIGVVSPRCVVSTCSYEARKYGVHSAMPCVTAAKLCPSGIFVPGNMKLYSSVSKQVMSIISEYAPEIHQVSIDEAWLDMTGTKRLLGKPKDVAMEIKERVKQEVGITMSIGIAASPFIAKMASDFNKPDGLCMVSPGKEQTFIDAIGLEKIWGIGKSGLNLLFSRNLRTPAQIREYDKSTLVSMLGNAFGEYLFKAVRGIDPNDYSGVVRSHSISTEQTFIRDVTDRQTLQQVLIEMSNELICRSFNENIMAQTVGLKLRWGDFRTITVQTTPDYPILNSDSIYSLALELLNSRWKEGEGVRLIGLGLYKTYSGDKPIQDSLFSDNEHKKRDLDKAVYKLGAKGIVVKKGFNGNR